MRLRDLLKNTKHLAAPSFEATNIMSTNTRPFAFKYIYKESFHFQFPSNESTQKALVDPIDICTSSPGADLIQELRRWIAILY